MVSTQPVSARLVLDDDCIPARTSATVSLDSQEADITVKRLLILDDAGNTVLSRTDATMPFTWNLTDNNGEPVPDGLYRAHVLFTTPTAKGSSTQAEIVVIR